jgi:hypothetical protein
VVDGVNLEGAGRSFIPGVMGPEGDVFFQETTGVSAAEAPGGELIPVRFQGAVDGLPRESGFLG